MMKPSDDHQMIWMHKSHWYINNKFVIMTILHDFFFSFHFFPERKKRAHANEHNTKCRLEYISRGFYNPLIKFNRNTFDFVPLVMQQ